MKPTKPTVHTKLTQQETAKTIIFLFFTLVIGFFVIKWSCSDDEPRGFGKLQAFTHAKNFVKKELKSPSTAEFCGNFDDFIVQPNDSTFVIDGCLDSQNGFGAMVRSTYTCKIIYHASTQMAELQDLVIK